MKVSRIRLDGDPGFLHAKGWPEIERWALLVDGEAVGEASRARREARDSWLVRPTGFPDFVKDPGIRLDRKPMTRAIAFARLEAIHAARSETLVVGDAALPCLGPLHLDGDAGQRVHLGHDGVPFELRIARREREVEDFPSLLGWDCYCERRDGRPIFVTGGATAEDAAAKALALRAAPASVLEESVAGGSIPSRALIGYGSLLDLAKPSRVPATLRWAQDLDGSIAVGPLPGEILYRMAPSGSGWDLLDRDGRRLLAGTSREDAFAFLGIEAPMAEEPAGPAP